MKTIEALNCCREWEWSNVALCLILIPFLLTKKSRAIVIALFVYCSFHFSFSAWPLLTDAPKALILKAHTQGGGLLAMCSAVFILVMAFVGLVVVNIQKLSTERQLLRVFLVCSALILVGYALNVRADIMQLKNIVCTLLMLGFLFFMSLSSWQSWAFSKRDFYIATFVTVVMVSVGFFELYSLRAWATFNDSSGETIFRASSLMFNPNLFGLWCVLIALGTSYLFQCKVGDRVWVLSLLVAALTGLYMAGSRGLAIALFLSLLFIAILPIKGTAQKRWIPSAILSTVFVFWVMISSLMSSLNNSFYAHWNPFVLLGRRFTSLPNHIFSYFGNQLSPRNISVPVEVVESIEGRFDGKLRDSGWLVMYDDAGWLGLAALVGLWCYFTFLGFHSYQRRRDITSVYALAALAVSAVTGVMMRFQIFPTGLFVALTLAPCLSYWREEKS